MTHEWQSVVEWLHEHPSRCIVIRASGRRDVDGGWTPREHTATFTLTTRIPDGRKVASSVEIRDEVMMEPLAGDLIIHEAKTAIDHLLSKPTT